MPKEEVYNCYLLKRAMHKFKKHNHTSCRQIHKFIITTYLNKGSVHADTRMMFLVIFQVVLVFVVLNVQGDVEYCKDDNFQIITTCNKCIWRSDCEWCDTPEASK
jgi:hypothetical protein